MHSKFLMSFLDIRSFQLLEAVFGGQQIEILKGCFIKRGKDKLKGVKFLE